MNAHADGECIEFVFDSMHEIRSYAHQGECYADCKRGATMLGHLDADLVRRILKPYGGWNEQADHEMNLIRLLWIAAGDALDLDTTIVVMAPS